MSAATKALAKLFAAHIGEKAEGEGSFFCDYEDGKIGVDGTIDLEELAEIALDFDPEEHLDPVDFDCSECGGHNRHEPDCIRGKSPVDTGSLRRSIKANITQRETTNGTD